MSTAKVKPPKAPTLSGFCNPSWRLDTDQGKASHARCHKGDCPCVCHLRWTITLPVEQPTATAA